MNINPNLLTGTRYFTGDWLGLFVGGEYLYQDPDLPDFNVLMTTPVQRWNGNSQYAKVSAGEIYTFSIYLKEYSGPDSLPLSRFYIELNSDNEFGFDVTHKLAHIQDTSGSNNKQIQVTKNWQRFSYTFKALNDGYIKPRFEIDFQCDTSEYSNLLIGQYGPKLERGSEMTPYCGTVEEGGGGILC